MEASFGSFVPSGRFGGGRQPSSPVAGMAAIAAAMTAVPIQPRPLTQPLTVKSPMTLGAAAGHIMIAMTVMATTPLTSVLQY